MSIPGGLRGIGLRFSINQISISLFPCIFISLDFSLTFSLTVQIMEQFCIKVSRLQTNTGFLCPFSFLLILLMSSPSILLTSLLCFCDFDDVLWLLTNLTTSSWLNTFPYLDLPEVSVFLSIMVRQTAQFYIGCSLMDHLCTVSGFHLSLAFCRMHVYSWREIYTYTFIGQIKTVRQKVPVDISELTFIVVNARLFAICCLILIFIRILFNIVLNGWIVISRRISTRIEPRWWFKRHCIKLILSGGCFSTIWSYDLWLWDTFILFIFWLICSWFSPWFANRYIKFSYVFPICNMAGDVSNGIVNTGALIEMLVCTFPFC